MLDVQQGLAVKVLDHGHVILHEVMGSDASISRAARISYGMIGGAPRTPTQEAQLLRYLMRHKHTSPFEMGEMLFEVKMPIFVARQWIRHRTANVNELSARYTQLPAEMFVPAKEELKPQSTSNKQGRDENGYWSHEVTAMRRMIRDRNQEAYNSYEDLIDEYDLARELARGVLPLNTYTVMIWKIDLHNLFHFLKLRTDENAQKEIVAYADVIEKFVKLKFPISHHAWLDYSKNAYTLSAMELEFVQQMFRVYSSNMDPGNANVQMQLAENKFKAGTTDRERKEFRAKILAKVPVGDPDDG